MISRIWKLKNTQNVNNTGYPKYEPVMFDMVPMDPFGDKKVPCTKYQESGDRAGMALCEQSFLGWHVVA